MTNFSVISLFFLLVALHHIGRILGGSLPRAEGYKTYGYGEDYHEGGDIEPPRLCNAVGELLQPARGDIPRHRCCHHKATSDNPHIAQVKHLDNLACRCAIDLANSNL